MFLRFQEEKTFWQKIPSRVSNNSSRSILYYLKSSDIFCPRKLFWAKIPLPKKALQKISLDFCLKNQSCDRRQIGYLARDTLSEAEVSDRVSRCKLQPAPYARPLPPPDTWRPEGFFQIPYSSIPGSRNWQVETADWIWPVSFSVL